jgi:hypothetical protein
MEKQIKVRLREMWLGGDAELNAQRVHGGRSEAEFFKDGHCSKARLINRMALNATYPMIA